MLPGLREQALRTHRGGRSRRGAVVKPLRWVGGFPRLCDRHGVAVSRANHAIADFVATGIGFRDSHDIRRGDCRPRGLRGKGMGQGLQRHKATGVEGEPDLLRPVA